MNLIETFMRPIVKTRKGHRVKIYESPYLLMGFYGSGWTGYVPSEKNQQSIYDVIKELDLLNVDYVVEKYTSNFGYGSCLLVVTAKHGKYHKAVCFKSIHAIEVAEMIEKITIIEPKSKLERELALKNNYRTRRNKI